MLCKIHSPQHKVPEKTKHKFSNIVFPSFNEYYLLFHSFSPSPPFLPPLPFSLPSLSPSPPFLPPPSLLPLPPSLLPSLPPSLPPFPPQTIVKLFELYVKLRELGHPQYLTDDAILPMYCSSLKDQVDTMVQETRLKLTKWTQQVSELRSSYKWLLYFSVPRMLQLHQLVHCAALGQAEMVDRIVHEVSFLTVSQPREVERLRQGVMVSFLGGGREEREGGREEREGGRGGGREGGGGGREGGREGMWMHCCMKRFSPFVKHLLY